MSGTELPTQKISDEDAELLARRAWRRRHSITWESGADEDRQPFLTAARLDLAALTEAGYRREADVRAAIAFEIRAELVCCDIYERLSKERDERRWRTEQTKGHDLCYWGEGAARIAESHELRTLNGAAALEQAQPLLVAGECVSGRRADGAPLPPMCCGGWADRNGGAATLCDPCPPEGQERSEEKRCPNCAPGYDCERGIYEPVSSTGEEKTGA